MTKILLFITTLCFSTLTLASNVPYSTEESANASDHDSCVADYADDCVNMICVEGDTSIDCTQHCKEVAEDKCQVQEED